MNKITQNVAKSFKKSLILPLLLTILSFGFSLSHGSVILTDIDLILKLRLPRALAAFTSGGLLALSGCLTQLLLQNPLADPYVLGISGGAAFTILFLMASGVTGFSLLLGGWLGSLGAICLILSFSFQHRFQSHALLLIGVALASGFAAGITFILLMSSNSNLHNLLFWLCGDLNIIDTPWFELSILLVGGFICYLLAPGLNLLYRGEIEARSLGLASTSYRIVIFLLSSLFTTTAVTLTGTIGFLGLIVPHSARKWLGLDHRLLIPGTILLGGSVLMLADTLSRSLFSPQQIPVGIMLAFIGVPFFVGLLRRG